MPLNRRLAGPVRRATALGLAAALAACGQPAAAPGDENAGMVETDDARVAGTDFNATAEVLCATDGGVPAQRCKAGVKRKQGEDGTTIVEVTRPDGRTRSLFFRGTAAFGASSAAADGSAGYVFTAERDGDETRISFGPERYVVPDVFVTGD